MDGSVELSGSVEHFAKRSTRTVLFITVMFALLPALLGRSLGRPWEGLGVLWMPFCFLTIPIIHHLCRAVFALQVRVSHLEKDHIT
jgi:hypothetical protein